MLACSRRRARAAAARRRAAAAAARGAPASAQRAVVGLDARHLQQLGDHRLVLVGALAQVDRGEVEAEHLHRAHQRRQARRDQRLRMVRSAATLRSRAGRRATRSALAYGVLRRHRVAQRLGAGERRAASRPGARTCRSARAGTARPRGARCGRASARPARAAPASPAPACAEIDSSAPSSCTSVEVEAQRRLALARQRHAQRGGADVRVAVAVAADPVAHAEEACAIAWPGSALLELAVQARDLAQEGAR